MEAKPPSSNQAQQRRLGSLLTALAQAPRATLIKLNLADEACEDALLDSPALRRFVGIDLRLERVREGGPGAQIAKLLNKSKSRVRSRVEHVFAVVKRLWGFSKVR